MKKTTVGFFAMIACLLWASAFPALKTLYRVVDMSSGTGSRMALAGMRFTLAGIVILVTYMLINKKTPLPASGEWGKIMLIGLFQTAGLYSADYISINNITGVKASVLSQSGIFIVIVLAFFVLHEHIDKNKALGILFGLIGILTVNMNGFLGQNNLGQWFEFNLFGEGFMLLSGLMGSIGTILVKKVGKNVNPMLLNGWQMTFGGGLLLLVGGFMNEGLVKLDSPLAISMFIHLVIIASVGFTIWYTLLKKVKVSDIVPYRLTIPIMGSVFSAVFLPGEKLSFFLILGISFVASGIYIANKPKKAIYK